MNDDAFRSCQRTSPDDAVWCIECGASFAITGATERLHDMPNTSGSFAYRVVFANGEASAAGLIAVFLPIQEYWGYRVGFGSADYRSRGTIIS